MGRCNRLVAMDRAVFAKELVLKFKDDYKLQRRDDYKRLMRFYLIDVLVRGLNDLPAADLIIRTNEILPDQLKDVSG